MIGILGGLLLVASFIINLVMASKQDDDNDRKTLFASGLMTAIATFGFIMLTVISLALTSAEKSGD